MSVLTLEKGLDITLQILVFHLIVLHILRGNHPLAFMQRHINSGGYQFGLHALLNITKELARIVHIYLNRNT